MATTSVRLREIASQRAIHFKVLPYTNTGAMEMLLDELGCARPCFKPATAEQLALAIQRTLDMPTRPLPTTPLAALVHQHALLAEQHARQERALKVALLAAAMPVRLGLHQLLTGAGARIVAEEGTADALRHLLTRYHAPILVADASDRYEALDLAASHSMSVLVVATSYEHLPLLDADLAFLDQALGIVDLTDDQAPLTLARALAMVARGQRLISLPYDRVIPPQGAILPPAIDQQLAHTGLTARERQVLWLDAHQWSTAQIARRFGVSVKSVDSYWKRIQRKLGNDRQGAREWLEAQIGRSAPQGSADELERSVGGDS